MISQELMLLNELKIKEEFKQHSIVFFDADCSFCNETIRFIIHNDKRKMFYFINIREIYNDPKNIELLYRGKFFFKSKAISIILSQLSGFYSILGFLIRAVPLFISNGIYDVIAENRKKIFSNSAVCEIYPEEIQKRFLTVADISSEL